MKIDIATHQAKHSRNIPAYIRAIKAYIGNSVKMAERDSPKPEHPSKGLYFNRKF